MQVSQQQITEWLDNPVTEALAGLVELELDAALDRRGIEAFCPFQPERTQELLATLNGYREAWEDILETLDGKGLWELDYDGDSTEDEVD